MNQTIRDYIEAVVIAHEAHLINFQVASELCFQTLYNVGLKDFNLTLTGKEKKQK